MDILCFFILKQVREVAWCSYFEEFKNLKLKMKRAWLTPSGYFFYYFFFIQKLIGKLKTNKQTKRSPLQR